MVFKQFLKCAGTSECSISLCFVIFIWIRMITYSLQGKKTYWWTR